MTDIYINPVLSDLIKSWYNFLTKNMNYSEHTAVSYHKDVCLFFEDMFRKYEKPQSIENCANYNMDDFRDFMANRKQDDISHSSIGRNLSGIRSFMDYLKNHHNIKNEDLYHIRAPKKAKLLPHAIDFEDIQIAANYLKNDSDKRDWVRIRNYSLLILLYGTGIRISEALKFTISEINSSQIKIHGKGGKDRFVPILPFVKNALIEYNNILPFIAEKKDFLFRGIRGGIMSQRDARLVLEKMRFACGLPEYFTPHALRHSCASHMLSSGADLRHIQDLLGHKSLSATEKYLDVKYDHLREVFSKAHPYG